MTLKYVIKVSTMSSIIKVSFDDRHLLKSCKWKWFRWIWPVSTPIWTIFGHNLIYSFEFSSCFSIFWYLSSSYKCKWWWPTHVRVISYTVSAEYKKYEIYFTKLSVKWKYKCTNSTNYFRNTFLVDNFFVNNDRRVKLSRYYSQDDDNTFQYRWNQRLLPACKNFYPAI